MTNPLLLSDAQQVIGRQWSRGPAPEQERTLGFARDALDFISATGQWYPLVDFRERGGPHGLHASGDDGPPALRELLHTAETFFGKRLKDPEAAGEQVAIQLLLDVLRFILVTRQLAALGDFREHIAAKAPPFAVARFETLAEAEAWLASHPSPPAFAEVLVGERYHDVVYERETGFRRLPWNRHLERYLAWLQREEPPVAAASFATKEEARAWLAGQPHPPRRTWVMVAGELHLAVSQPHLHHRALHPLSLARGHEEASEEP